MNFEDCAALSTSHSVAAASSGLFALICFCALSSAGRIVSRLHLHQEIWTGFFFLMMLTLDNFFAAI